MSMMLRAIRTLIPVVVVGALAHVALSQPNLLSLSAFDAACSKPLTYAIRNIDPRFSLSKQELEEIVEDAASVWNDAGSVQLLASSTDAEIYIDLVYDERQQAIELGAEINEEQQQYLDMRDEIDTLRARFNTLKNRYEAAVRSFERDVAAYEEEVERWNARGGAPPSVYAELAVSKAALSDEQASLGSQAATIESIGRDINARVATLNALVSRLNSSAETFNETLGHDFDQGNYVSDEEGKRITIYTFETHTELTRVIAHEFGHALGIGHVENPESLMYSYNIGDAITFSPEDLAALQAACAE